MAIQNNTPFVRHVGGTEGATGWSRTDVLSAIEQVLADAGVHGSSTRKGGVIVNCLAPGSTDPYNYNGNSDVEWKNTGGGQVITPTTMYWNIRVTVSAGDYVLTPIWQPNYFYANGEIRFNRLGDGNGTFATNISNGISYDQVSGVKHAGWATGDQVIFRNPSSGNTMPAIAGGGSLTAGTTYYLIVPDDYDDITQTTYYDTVKIATSLANAQAGTAITFDQNYNYNTATYDSDINQNDIEFEFPAVGAGKLSVRQEDYITFHLTGLSGHPTTIVDTDDTSLTFPGGTYSDVRELKQTATATLSNFESISYRDMPTGIGLETGRIVWHTRGWTQGDYVLQCQNHTGMQSTIEIKPSAETYTATYNKPYWDYTVPQSVIALAGGGTRTREACTFRVYRRTYEEGWNERGKILGVRIQTEGAKGWIDDDVFTIPGDQIGGSTPTHDIVFGVNSSTTQQIADKNAVPSVQVMDVGSGGTNFYARYNQVNSAIVEITNDSNKTYGTTFYGIKLNPANEYELIIGSGVGWRYMNWNPTTTTDSYEGGWSGDNGFDVANSTYSFNYSDEHYSEFAYGVGSNATSYPMKVQVWKANNSDPQDPNFFVLQFVQNVAGNDESQLSLYFHKGTVLGNGIWDLDHVWQGGFTSFTPTTHNTNEEIIRFETHLPRNYRASYETVDIAYSNRSLRRCAEWGYLRDSNSDSTTHHSAFTDYANNIFTDNDQMDTVVPYFRDSSYDKSTTVQNLFGENSAVDISYTGGTTGTATGGKYDYNGQMAYYPGNKSDVPAVIQVSPSADYYKPIKGLPIQNGWAPVPYYLPDDYVIIPFNVTPGATTFHTGDSIEVSASEIYKIIEVKYSVNQTTYDNITSNSCKGIAFCARTT